VTLPPELFSAFHPVSQIIGRALDDLEVVAHRPIQGMAMHRVIAARILQELPKQGYIITRTQEPTP
jgi:hypothetical protein